MVEGDTVKHDCPSNLMPLAGQGVEWFHDEERVDPGKHSRVRFSKRK